MTNNNGVPIKAMGRIVGHVVGKEFVKHVDSRVHFLRKPPGIAVDKRSLHDAMKSGATKVRIIDKVTGAHYVASCDYIRKNADDIDRGWGEQYVLPMRRWQKIDPRQGELI